MFYCYILEPMLPFFLVFFVPQGYYKQSFCRAITMQDFLMECGSNPGYIGEPLFSPDRYRVEKTLAQPFSVQGRRQRQSGCELICQETAGFEPKSGCMMIRASLTG